MATKVEVPLAPVCGYLVVCQHAVPVVKQKILGRFLKLTLTRFSGAQSKDTCVFLIAYEDILHNFSLTNICAIDSILYSWTW